MSEWISTIRETPTETRARLLLAEREARLLRMETALAAPESLRERLAAEIAHEDAQALRMPPEDAAAYWEIVKDVRAESADYYRRCADRVLRVITESALR